MYTTPSDSRVGQGDVFKDLSYQYITNGNEISTTQYPFWVVVSQDCDLEHDYNTDIGKEGYNTDDKRLQTILLVPAFVAEQLRAGTHMAINDWTMQSFNSGLWSPVKQNNHPRYHYLEKEEGSDLPDLVIDFKRFYTFPREYIYDSLELRVSRLNDLYKEAASTRFSNYLCRIALPELVPRTTT